MKKIDGLIPNPKVDYKYNYIKYISTGTYVINGMTICEFISCLENLLNKNIVFSFFSNKWFENKLTEVILKINIFRLEEYILKIP